MIKKKFTYQASNSTFRLQEVLTLPKVNDGDIIYDCYTLSKIPSELSEKKMLIKSIRWFL